MSVINHITAGTTMRLQRWYGVIPCPVQKDRDIAPAEGMPTG
jgi:hypothetical protein